MASALGPPDGMQMPDGGDLRSEGPATVLILAGGYGTRMGAIGRDRPKALLPLDGRTVLDHLMDRIAAVGAVDDGLLVTNRRFAEQFRAWRRGRTLPFPVEIVDDGTTRPEERLGAVGDLSLALKHADLPGPLLVAGSDNVFAFPLHGLLRSLLDEPRANAVVTVVAEEDPRRLRASGIPEVDQGGRIVRFREKPDEPRSRMVSPPLYAFRHAVLRDVERYLDEGGDPDAPGHFLEWLVERRSVYAWEAPGARHDVGTPERYESARRRLSGGAG